MKKGKLKLGRTQWLKVNDPKNSESTTFLNRLDWKHWWTDGSVFFGAAYIHVRHLEDRTIHRVYCRKAIAPRLGMKDGELYWLMD